MRLLLLASLVIVLTGCASASPAERFANATALHARGAAEVNDARRQQHEEEQWRATITAAQATANAPTATSAPMATAIVELTSTPEPMVIVFVPTILVTVNAPMAAPMVVQPTPLPTAVPVNNERDEGPTPWMVAQAAAILLGVGVAVTLLLRGRIREGPNV